MTTTRMLEVYKLINELSDVCRKADAWDVTNERHADAWAYAERYFTGTNLGRNIWHTILDDAIRLRQQRDLHSDC